MTDVPPPWCSFPFCSCDDDDPNVHDLCMTQAETTVPDKNFKMERREFYKDSVTLAKAMAEAQLIILADIAERHAQDNKGRTHSKAALAHGRLESALEFFVKSADAYRPAFPIL